MLPSASRIVARATNVNEQPSLNKRFPASKLYLAGIFLLDKPVRSQRPRPLDHINLDVEFPYNLRNDLGHLQQADVFADTSPSSSTKLELGGQHSVHKVRGSANRI